jgi:transglutaminase-like putative cysteine protease
MKLDSPLNTSLIYGLLVSVLLISAPHAGHLPLWVSSLSAVLLGWRAWLAYSNKPLPPRWLLLAIVAGSVGGILISFHTLFGREAGVTLLILLAALKLLEVRSARDATIVIYLACFVIITEFFYSQSIFTALFMFVTLLVVVTTWVHLQSGTLALRPRLRIAGILLLQAIPLTLILFILFPRIQGPLWGLPQDAYASSGLDDKMSPGSVGHLALSDAVAFRVMFNGQPPQRGQMYWRGPVLLNFDGHIWTQGQKDSAHIRPKLDNLALPIDYTVTLEPHNKTWLFTLEMPTQISVPAGMTYDFQVQQNSPVTSRLRYTAHSQLGYRANAEEDPRQLLRALTIPHNLNPRAQQLAASWRTNNVNSAGNTSSPFLTSPRREEGQSPSPPGEVLVDDEAVVRTALAYYSREGFQYTLSPPPLGTHEIDDFLFGTRKGFCEHYASSFVFLMRAAGVPARVVTGYQGGEYNTLGKYYIVRQSDAHAWAEVWLRGRGWVRIDPTAAIAPARVELGMAAALPESDSATLPLLERTQLPWLINFRFNLDALTNQWNQWVLGYNPERQFALLTRMGMEEITWQNMVFTMLGGIALLVGLFTLLMLRQLTVRNTDEAQRLYLKFCSILAKKGIVRDIHEGPQDFAARAAQRKPQLAPAIADITAHYVALRYGNQPDASALQALRRAVAAFKL